MSFASSVGIDFLGNNFIKLITVDVIKVKRQVIKVKRQVIKVKSEFFISHG